MRAVKMLFKTVFTGGKADLSTIERVHWIGMTCSGAS